MPESTLAPLFHPTITWLWSRTYVIMSPTTTSVPIYPPPTGSISGMLPAVLIRYVSPDEKGCPSGSVSVGLFPVDASHIPMMIKPPVGGRFAIGTKPNGSSLAIPLGRLALMVRVMSLARVGFVTCIISESVDIMAVALDALPWRDASLVPIRVS